MEKSRCIKSYKQSCYKLLQVNGLLVNGYFKSKNYIDNKSKAALNKKNCRRKNEN